MKQLLIAFFCISILLSCEENKSSELTLIIPIEQMIREASSGNIVIYNIAINSASSELCSLKITEISSDKGIIELGDIALNGSSESIDYQYSVPSISSEEESVTLKFTANTIAGKSISISAEMKIIGSASIALESTSITMYGAESGAQNGYSFYKKELVSQDATSDQYMDIYDMPNERDSTTLSREWRSKTGLSFARLTGFNYSEANPTTIAEGYSVATKLDKITNINDEDIIFIGLDSQTPLSVIKVNNIYDSDGYLSDRYSLSMKILDVDYPEPEIKDSDL
ncbi:MAG: hypothetical protein SNH88_03215 [Rikenellaceae bacterium]